MRTPRDPGPVTATSTEPSRSRTAPSAPCRPPGSGASTGVGPASVRRPRSSRLMALDSVHPAGAGPRHDRQRSGHPHEVVLAEAPGHHHVDVVGVHGHRGAVLRAVDGPGRAGGAVPDQGRTSGPTSPNSRLPVHVPGAADLQPRAAVRPRALDHRAGVALGQVLAGAVGRHAGRASRSAPGARPATPPGRRSRGRGRRRGRGGPARRGRAPLITTSVSATTNVGPVAGSTSPCRAAHAARSGSSAGVTSMRSGTPVSRSSQSVAVSDGVERSPGEPGAQGAEQLAHLGDRGASPARRGGRRASVAATAPGSRPKASTGTTTSSADQPAGSNGSRPRTEPGSAPTRQATSPLTPTSLEVVPSDSSQGHGLGRGVAQGAVGLVRGGAGRADLEQASRPPAASAPAPGPGTPRVERSLADGRHDPAVPVDAGEADGDAQGEHRHAGQRGPDPAPPPRSAGGTVAGVVAVAVAESGGSRARSRSHGAGRVIVAITAAVSSSPSGRRRPTRRRSTAGEAPDAR